VREEINLKETEYDNYENAEPLRRKRQTKYKRMSADGAEWWVLKQKGITGS
jgi:hypothetical protein